jgi:2-dehydro-3-deoxyphosphogalactonate aldolase
MNAIDALFVGPPLVAILRGLRPTEAVEIGSALVDAGITTIEVPLNSPEPFQSIARLSRDLAGASVGAGTVLTPDEARRAVDSGARFVVSPNFDSAVVTETKRLGVGSCPGVATPSEGFAALDAGADVLKLFPAEQLGPEIVKAWSAVFPAQARLLPVGGITTERIELYLRAGASGFGIGSALFRPGLSPDEVGIRARRFVLAYRSARDVIGT